MVTNKVPGGSKRFFGKRGLPWHITYAIRLRPRPSCNSSSSFSVSSSPGNNRSFEHRTFCLVFDNAKQDGRTVTSILYSVIIIIFALYNSYEQDTWNMLMLLTYDDRFFPFRFADDDILKGRTQPTGQFSCIDS